MLSVFIINLTSFNAPKLESYPNESDALKRLNTLDAQETVNRVFSVDENAIVTNYNVVFTGKITLQEV